MPKALRGPCCVRIEETVWITLSDGCRLAAKLWLPDATEPAPAILEYLPYRRRDRHRGDDAILHPAFAEAGYAAIRVDLRGAGDSDGVLRDEYTPGEWADAVEVIAWIAAQPWCSGRVGMIGLSWSGFNSLQVAALAPPALKAIVTTCASDDRYADDMHYMGGCLLSDNLQYGATLFTWMATPPDPAIVGDRWREMWRERLAAIDEPPAARWMRHGTRDAYWRSGSVCENYGAISAAVLAVGGWADGYVNAVMRLLEGLPGPRKGLIGPWGHAYPHVATPGPGIDFLAYVIRWWDHWLRDIDTGMMDEPMLTAWMQEAEPPRAQYDLRDGHWVAEATWPSAHVQPRRFHLGANGLSGTATAFAASIKSPATTGLASGEWCPYGWGPDMPLDQREDDAGSLTFDTVPLAHPLDILGRARVHLTLSCDQTEGMIALRLSAVAPDGTASRITYGLLNLRHRDGHAGARPLTPGEAIDVVVDLKATGFALPVGYRLRVSVSTAYWPLATPLPGSATVTLHAGALDLPLRVAEGPAPAIFGPAWSPPPLEAVVIEPPARGRITATRTIGSGETTLHVVRNLGALRIIETGLTLRGLGHEDYSIVADDAGAARSETWRLAEFDRPDWQAKIETHCVLTATPDAWHLVATLAATEGATVIDRRSWDLLIPR
jgi:putative CocE/NonD family hydrolase